MWVVKTVLILSVSLNIFNATGSGDWAMAALAFSSLIASLGKN